MNQPHVSAAVLVSSVFLLRVQSETMNLEVGFSPRRYRQADTVQSGLNHPKKELIPSTSSWPEGKTGRKAACWCVPAPALERPRIVAQYMQWHRCSVTKNAGASLIDLTSSSFLKAVRRMLTLLGHKHANKCTLKAFRAGRATSLAAAGSPIGVILAAGELKSSAFLRYCQTDEISVSAVLEVVCAEDED